MLIRSRIKTGQYRFRRGSKVSSKNAKLSISVSLHLRNKSVSLYPVLGWLNDGFADLYVKNLTALKSIEFDRLLKCGEFVINLVQK